MMDELGWVAKREAVDYFNIGGREYDIAQWKKKTKLDAT
jgi:hypothetical protein